MGARGLGGWLKTMTREVRDRAAHSRDPIGYWRAQGARIGADCRLIGCNFGSEPYLVTLGDHVSATDVGFVTHDGGIWVFRGEWPDADVIAPITVGDNVFLGTGTVILPGVTIGDNVVVGALSVVSRDIPSDTVAAGAPAKPLRELADYRATMAERVVPVRHLDRAAKRAWLERHFHG